MVCVRKWKKLYKQCQFFQSTIQILYFGNTEMNVYAILGYGVLVDQGDERVERGQDRDEVAFTHLITT